MNRRILAQYLTPKRLLSRAMGRFTRITWPWLKNWCIRTFCKKYNVDLSLSANPDITSYQHFDDFFTRPLRDGIRSAVSEPGALACPVDGYVSEFGAIKEGQLYQAKGQYYSLLSLLGNQQDWETLFAAGHFATFYLSPRDYHRVHMPEAGQLMGMCYVPGDFFSVNPLSVQHIPRLFARNERVVSIFKTPAGYMAVILIGAMCVGSMETRWAGVVAPNDLRTVQRIDYTADAFATTLQRGEEMGRFHMGSTAIILWSEPSLMWDSSMQPDVAVNMGQRIAY